MLGACAEQLPTQQQPARTVACDLLIGTVLRASKIDELCPPKVHSRAIQFQFSLIIKRRTNASLELCASVSERACRS